MGARPNGPDGREGGRAKVVRDVDGRPRCPARRTNSRSFRVTESIRKWEWTAHGRRGGPSDLGLSICLTRVSFTDSNHVQF